MIPRQERLRGIHYRLSILESCVLSAYGNLLEEVAKILKRVICGDDRRYWYVREIEEIGFAIFDEGQNPKEFV